MKNIIIRICFLASDVNERNCQQLHYKFFLNLQLASG